MKTKQIARSIKYFYYTAIGIQIIAFLSIAFKWINVMSDTVNIPLSVQRYALLLTLISIPGALKLFFIIMKKNNRPEDEKATYSFYVRAFTVRFSILFLVASINIILFAFSLSQNFLLCTLITFTAYLFTSPSVNYLNEHEA